MTATNLDMNLVVDHRLAVRRHKVALVAAVRSLITMHTLGMRGQRVFVWTFEVALRACERLLCRMLGSLVSFEARSLRVGEIALITRESRRQVRVRLLFVLGYVTLDRVGELALVAMVNAGLGSGRNGLDGGHRDRH
jgi:hypothetical protein